MCQFLTSIKFADYTELSHHHATFRNDNSNIFIKASLKRYMYMTGKKVVKCKYTLKYT